MSAEWLRMLLETTLATSAAALLVLLLRRPLMARLGAGIAYAAWMLVPVAGLAMLLPAPPAAVAPMVQGAVVALPPLSPVSESAPLAWTMWMLSSWALGVLATVALFARQQWRFQRRIADSTPYGDGLRIARSSEGLPAVVGLWRPHIVLPADFDTRYDAGQRELILCHERIHVVRRDLWANAVAVALCALFWFNPLLHVAARRFRRDQELACDARVVACHPQRRRSYADAMLKTHMADSPLPVGCHWQAFAPLKERIAMLKEHAPGPARTVVGAALVSLLLLGGGYAAWAAQPEKADEAKAGSQYSVDIALQLEGATRNFRTVTSPGKPFSFAARTDEGHAWRGEFVLQERQHPGKEEAMLSAELSEDGRRIASPMTVLRLGEPGRIELRSGNGPADFGMDVLVNRAGDGTRPGHDQDAVAAHVDIASKNTHPPSYPPDAARSGVGGKVVVIVDVDADGTVAAAEIESSEPAGVFDDVVLTAVRKWKFEPAIENGRPVAGRVRVPVDFRADPPAQAPKDNG